MKIDLFVRFCLRVAIVTFCLMGSTAIAAQGKENNTQERTPKIVDFKLRVTLPATQAEIILGWGGVFDFTLTGISVGLEFLKLVCVEVGGDYRRPLYTGILIDRDQGTLSDDTGIDLSVQKETFDLFSVYGRAGFMPVVADSRDPNKEKGWVLQIGGFVGYRLDLERSRHNADIEQQHAFTVDGAIEGTHWWRRHLGFSLRLLVITTYFVYDGYVLAGLGISLGIAF